MPFDLCQPCFRRNQASPLLLGTLNTAKDNAILIPTWYSGTNKIMQEVYIGNGRALDPDTASPCPWEAPRSSTAVTSAASRR